MAEVAGLALGVVPLLISASEHYCKIYAMVKRYKRYAHEMEDFCADFCMQRTIFEMVTKNLLASITGREAAAVMLANPDHPHWTDSLLQRALHTRLRDVQSSIEVVVARLKDRFATIEQECHKYEEILSNLSKKDSTPKEWRTRVGMKLKVAIRKEKLQGYIEEVRKLNQDYQNLLGLTETFTDRTAVPRLLQTNLTNSPNYTLVQKAAGKLYAALQVACTKHTEHRAHLSLQPALGAKAANVKFSLSLRRQALHGIMDDQSRPTWLTIETVFTGDMVATSSSSVPVNDLPFLETLKRPQAFDDPVPEKLVQKRKVVRFLPVTPPCSQPPLASSKTKKEVVQPVASAPILPNLCKHNNFCTLVESSLQGLRPSVEPSCVGYLEQCPELKYLVYLNSKTESIVPSINVEPEMTTLENIISCATGTPSDKSCLSMSQLHRLGLARQLATAVLNFHDTPWLNSSWSSRDVYLYGLDSVSRHVPSGSQEPFVNIAVKQIHEQIPDQHTYSSRALSRNPFLFGLGVVMLELGLEQPLEELQDPADDLMSSDSRHIEFFTARRISRTKSTPFGIHYSNIIKKCLGCDFGCGDDLKDPKLQQSVYQDVVCELEQLEKGLRALGLT